MTKIDTERHGSHLRHPRTGLYLQFLNGNKNREGHHEHVDATEQPQDFEVGIITGELFIHQHITSVGNGIAQQEHRNADTRTEAQKESLLKLLHRLKTDYPQARIVGHHDLDPRKACPCFEVRY